MKIILFIAFLSLIISCDQAAYRQLEPSRLIISPAKVQAAQGSALSPHAVTEAWLYIDDRFAGVYSLPANIPLLETGDARTINIYAGIRDFGIRSRPEIYTLLDPIALNTGLEPGKEYTIHPLFRYKNGLTVHVHDGFESGNPFSMDLDDNKQHHITRTGLQALEGIYSGHIVLNAANPVLEAGTSFFRLNASSYLEMSFRSSVDFNIGIQLTRSGASLKDFFFLLKASGEWKTVYIPFREILDRYPGDTFQVILRAELPSSAVESYIFLDLIKILSQP